MSPPPKPGGAIPQPVTAGSLLVGAMVLCALVAYAIGSLFGAAVPMGLAGLFAGLVVGFVLVHARFRDL